MRTRPLLSAFTLSCALAACASGPPAATVIAPDRAPEGPGAVARWTLGPARIACVGVAPMECLQYRDAPGGPWRAHHGALEGFELRPGDEVDLEVRFEAVERPPADGASQRVVVVRELERRTLPGGALPVELTGTPWRLDAMPGSGAALAGVEPTLGFEASSRVTGNAGINRFNAEVAVGEGWLRVGPAMSTRMAGPPEAMALEAEFLARLKRAGHWRARGDRLRLLDAAGAELLSFHREAPAVAP